MFRNVPVAMTDEDMRGVILDYHSTGEYRFD
jgi:hypothetical protein